MERLTEKKIGQSYPLKDKASSKIGLFTDYDGFYAYFEAVNRLGAIEDILGDDYDLDRLAVMMTQCMSMRDEVAERFRLTAKIPLDQLKDLVEAKRDGRCVVLPCKVGDTLYYADECGISVEHVEKIITQVETDECIYDLEEIGKNAFRTRSEAEEARKGELDG